jgi:LPXTG-site transpeptidase (sortase) family protein
MFMKSKFSPKWFLLVLGLAGTFLAILITLNFHLSKENFSAQTASVVGQTNLNLPIRFKIPRINVDAPVEYVGLTQGGAMDVPKKPEDVAWYNLGPRPGESGSAVIAGHSGYKNNKPAVFDNLHKLQKGDKVYVEDSNGNKITFVINKISSYKENQNATDVFSSNDGASHLNLITCTGVWDSVAKSHSERLIVFADKEVQ